ncbi:MAG: LamG domain-containing protein, partial [Pirellulaceae bacterium]|nr:LamG domain-containing protein [Pirellulaceae bacterium]
MPDGKIGGAVAFDGRDGYLAIPAAATRGLKQVTLAMWLKTRQAVAAPREQFWKNPTVLGAASSGPGSADLAIVVEDGKPGYHHGLEPGQDTWLFSDKTIHDGQWHQVALTRNGSDVRLFLDGQVAVVDTGPADGNVVEEAVSASGAGQALGGEGLFVGACNNTAEAGPAEHFFQGSVDDVRIWSRALSPAEIAALWTATTGQTVPVAEPVVSRPSRAEAPVEAAVDLSNSHGLSWRIEKRAGSQADQLDPHAVRLSGSTRISDVTFRFSLDLALRDDSPAAALTARWSVDRDLAGFEVCAAYHSVGLQDWRCTVYPFAGNSEAVDLVPLTYVGVPAVLMFRPDLSLVTLLGIDPASDYLNPNTWTGTTGFCFRNRALPPQYRAGGGKLTAGIEYALPLQVFLSDAGTSPAAVSRLVQDWIKVNRYQVEPMSIRTPAEALALYLKGRRNTNMWKPGQGYQLQDVWRAIYVPVSPQSAYFEYLLYEQTGDELWRTRCFEQLDFVLTAQLREPGPLCGYIHTCYLLNEKQFNSDDRGSNPGYKVDMNLHTARYLLQTWQHVKQREGIDRQDWYQAAVQAVDWALAQQNPDGGLPQKLDYGTLRKSISVCSGRTLAALPLIARITGDAKYTKALDGLEQFLRRSVEDRYWFTGQHPDLYPEDFESDSIWCSCEYWLDKYDRTQDAECLARAKANALFAFLMLCP